MQNRTRNRAIGSYCRVSDLIRFAFFKGTVWLLYGEQIGSEYVMSSGG